MGMNPKEPDPNNPVEGAARGAHNDRLDHPAPEEAVPDTMTLTERKGAEERARFQARLLDVVGQAIIATDVRGMVIYWNRVAEGLYGWSAAEVMGKPIMEVTLPEEMAERAQEIMTELLAGRSWSGEFTVRRKDGTAFPAMVTDTPVHDEEGNLVAVIGISSDVTGIKQTEELRRSEERFRSLVQNASDVITILEPDGTVRYVSPSVERVTGHKPEEQVGTNAFGSVHPDDRERAMGIFASMLNKPGAHPPLVFRVPHKDGSWRYLEHDVNNLLDNPSVNGIVINSRDITERKEAEDLVRWQADMLEQTHDAVFMWKLGGEIIYWNQGAECLYGWSKEEALGRISHELLKTLHPFTYEELENRLRRDGHWEGELVHHTRDDQRLVVDSRHVLTRYDSGPGFVLETNRDITERKETEERLKHQALHDPLTDLPNRQLLLDRLGHALTRTERRKGSGVAVLFMDLDGFKVVNDSLGHDTGDRLLVEVAERLKGCLRPEDTLARFGGDEFIVLLEEVEGAEDVLRVTQRITEEFREPFVLDERELTLRFSIGVALGAEHTKSPEELLRDADTAMYRAKEDAADYRVFDPVMHEQALNRIDLENDLRRALNKEEFTVYYQPKFRLLEQTERIEEVEALVRWEHPQRGFMLPEEFIPIAEETGLIIPIGGWVMKEACRQAKEWQERLPNEPPLSVCVNLSARQVRHPGLLKDVRSALGESGLAPGSLVLEITENTLLKGTEVIETVFKELKALGVRLAIDDFGKEYSSLSYLNRLPVDALKIDRLFLESFGDNPSNTIIVEAVISLAHSLGLEVTGEGVESAEQLELLRAMGCDLAQGYHLARPLPGDEVKQLLVNRTTS